MVDGRTGIVAGDISDIKGLSRAGNQDNVLLLDSMSGKVVEVPADQADEALATGRFGIRGGQAIDMVGPDGKLTTFEPEEVGKAIADGFRYGTTEDRKNAKLRSIAAEDEAGAFLSQAGSVASFGATDALTSDYEGEYRSLQKQENPKATIAGGVAGALSGALVGPGAIVGRGATALGGAAAGRVASPLAQALVRGTVSAGAEGAAYGAGNLVSEAAIGDAEINGESLIAHIGGGALLGGAFGGGVAGVGYAGRNLVRGLSKVGDRFRRSADDAVDDASEVLSASSAEASSSVGAASADDAASFASFKTGPKETITETITETPKLANIEKILGKPFTKEGAAFRSKAFASPKVRQDISKRFGDAARESVEQLDDVTLRQGQALRKKEISTLLKNQPREPAFESATTAADDMYRLVKEMRAEPDLYHPGVIRDVELSADTLATRLLSDELKTADDIYRVVTKTKAALGKKLEKYIGTTDPIVKDTRRIANERAYGALKRHLTDEKAYGTAASRTAAYNEAASRFVSAKKHLLKKFGEKLPSGEYKLVSQKLNTFLRGVGSERGETRNAIVKEFMDSAEEFLAQIDETAKIGGRADSSKARDALKKMVSTRKEAEDVLGAQNVLTQSDPFTDFRTGTKLDFIANELNPTTWAQRLHSVENLLGVNKTTQRTIVREGASEFTAGAAQSSSSSFFSEAAEKASKLSILHKATRKTSDSVTESAKSFVQSSLEERPPRKMKKIPAIAVLSQALSPGGATKGSPQELAKERSQEIADMMEDPNKLTEKIALRLSALEDVAPKTAQAMAAKSAQIVAFLDSKAPRDPSGTVNIQPLIPSRWEPTAAQAAKFARYMRAATQPLSVVQGLADGSVSQEEIETLKELYPRLFDATKQEIVENIQTAKKSLPYKDMVTLSLFFDIPLHDTMRPEFIARSQQTYQPDPPQGQAGGGKSLTGIKNLTLSNRSLSGSQGVEFRHGQ